MAQGQNGTSRGRPNYGFPLANERTFLARARTALAILAGAILPLFAPLPPIVLISVTVQMGLCRLRMT